MKKVLLGTSAIALAGAFASPADAVEWEVKVGGYTERYVAYSETDSNCCDGDFDGVEAKSDSEIHFSPSITLDNGLKFSARIELEGASSGDQIDETYADISGSFGMVRIGEDDLPSYNMAYTAPDVTFLNINSGSDTKFWGGTLLPGYTTTLPQVVTDPEHIAYYSPRFAGFQVGAGYARDGNRATVQGQQDQDVFGTLYDAWAIGANYVNAFGDFNIALSGGYTQAKDAADDKFDAWAAGLNLGYGGFTIGGSYKEFDPPGDISPGEGATESFANRTWDVGASYETGPWGFSFTYLRQSDDISGVDYDLNKYLLGINYAMAKGVNFNVFGVYADAEEDTTGIDEDGWIVGTGVKLSF